MLSNLDTAEPLVIHTAAAAGLRYPYEVLFRTLNKFLMDTACGEYLVSGKQRGPWAPRT